MPFNLYLSAFSFIVLCFCSCEESGDTACIEKVWYSDEDQDGLGNPLDSLLSCEQPAGYVSNADDSSETKPGIGESELQTLPGEQQKYVSGSTKARYGFYLYEPAEYNNEDEFPLLIFLHGGGARGNGSDGDLNKIIYDGPPKLIISKKWNPTHPMIIVSPQSPHLWDANKLHDFIDYLTEQLAVDKERIYMTGFSMGARGCFDYVARHADESHVAAIVPIAGWGTYTGEPFRKVAVWAFHGDEDNVLPWTGSLDIVERINAADPLTQAKLTIFPGVNHNSWTRTYDDSGMGDESATYDSFDQSIYDWMYLYTKN
ncbi:MAG: dienelactone hydrolase family protein [Cyclobacteriaceae bacterium]